MALLKGDPVPAYQLDNVLVQSTQGGIFLQDTLLECETYDTSDNESVLDFTLSLVDPKASIMEPEGTVLFKGRTYRIRTINTVEDDRQAIVQVHCERLWYNLLYAGNMPEASRYGTATQMLTLAVANSAWSVGEVSSTAIFTWTNEADTALGFINQVQKIYGGDLVFNDKDLTVNLVSNGGRDRGTTFTYERGIKGIKRRVDTSSLVTRLYARNADGETIAPVNSGVPYLENYTWTNELRIGEYNFAAGITPATMLQSLTGFIGNRSTPNISYEIDVAGLTDRTEEIDRFEVLDTIFVMDKDYSKSVKAKVTELRIDWLDLRKSKIVLGNKLRNLSDPSQPSYNPPSGVEDATAIPAAPTNLVLGTIGYWDNGNARSSIQATWTPVVLSTLGLPIDLSHYTLEVIGFGTVDASNVANAELMGIEAGVNCTVRVRAISSRGVPSAWSVAKTITTVFPLAQLTPPTIPLLRTGNGAINVVWDGKLGQSSAPFDLPLHFSHCLIQYRAKGTSPWQERSTNANDWTFVGLATGSEWEFRLIAVDQLGNQSSPGPIATIKVLSDAQTALDQLLVTQGDVAIALQNASNAATAAGLAQTAAGLAQTAANTAKDDAALAQQVAEQAIEDAANKATAAQIAAQEYALAAAEAAQLQAEANASEDAEIKAAAAQAAAKAAAALDATAKANAAQQAAEAKAQTAQQAAQAAQTTANTANTNAQNAAQAAADAAEAAIQADGKADQAAQAAQAAQTTANGANARLFRDWGVDKPTVRTNGSPLKQGDELVTRKDGMSVQVEVWNGTLWTNSYLLSGSVFVLSTAGTISLNEGVVDTPQLKAGAIDSFKITAPLIQSVETANRGIKWNGATLIGYTSTGVEAFRLDGNRATITAGIFQTTATANRGVKIDTTNGIMAWDTSGNVTAKITPDNTANMLVGDLYTSRQGSPGMILSKTSAGFSGVWFSSDGTLNDYDSAIYKDNEYSLMLRGVITDYGTYQSYAPPATRGLTVLGPLLPATTPINYPLLRLMSKNGRNVVGYLGWANEAGTLGTLVINDIIAQGRLQDTQHPTTTTAANAVLLPTSGSNYGRLFRSTSLRKDKKDIQNVSQNPYNLLKVPIRDWVDRTALADYEAQEDTGDELPYPNRIPGIVAEELEAAGLSEFCVYDADGSLQGVLYDRVALLLIPIVRELLERVDYLERKMEQC